MALIPGTNIPSSVSGTGTSARASLLSGHIFNAGLEKPEILESLIIKFPDFWFSKLLESIPQVSGEIDSDVYTWQIMDRTRKSAVLTYVSGAASAAIVVDTNIAAAGADLGYFRVGDTVRVAQTGAMYIVTVIAINGGVQRLTLAAVAGGVIAQADVDGYSIGHISADFARGSAGSGGSRVNLPTTDYNVTNIHRRGLTVERGVLAQKTYVDDKSWYFPQEDLFQKEFMRDFQAKLLFGKRFLDRAGVSQTKGIMTYAEESGQQVAFDSAVGVQEQDWGALAQKLLPQQGSDDLIVLMGERIMVENQYALRDYRTIPTSAVPQQLAGLGFQSYEIANKKFHFKYFDMFSDTAILPHITPSATGKDFRNTALVLDAGMVSGANQRNIQVKYRSGAKFIQKFITGMASPGAEVSNAYDGLQIELLTEFTTAVLLPNRLGLVYADK